MSQEKLYRNREKDINAAQRLADVLVKQDDDKVIGCLYDESDKELDFYMSSIDSLDTKMGIAIGLLGALIAILGALSFMHATLPIKWVSYVAVGFFACALVCAIKAYMPKDIMRSPDVEKLGTGYADMGVRDIKRNIIFYRAVDFRAYDRLLHSKRRCMYATFLLAFVGVLCLGVGIILRALRGL